MYGIKAAEMTLNQSFEGFESADHFLRVGGSLAPTESGELGWFVCLGLFVGLFLFVCFFCKTALIV